MRSKYFELITVDPIRSPDSDRYEYREFLRLIGGTCIGYLSYHEGNHGKLELLNDVIKDLEKLRLKFE